MTYRYQILAEDIQRMMASKTLKPGDKLPSLRRLSREKKLSISTVMQAYDTLLDQGLIEARPQSGYYVTSACELPLPQVRNETFTTVSEGRIDELVASILQSARAPGILPLGLTSLDAALLPLKALNRIYRQYLNHAHAHVYEETAGNARLRRHIARRSLDSHQPIVASEVIITSGCMEAIHLALRAVANPGDWIAVESPTYYGIFQAIEGLGMKVIEVPTDPQKGILLEALEQLLQQHPIKALVTIASFHNPTGVCLSTSHKQALVALCESFEIPMIEDDIYGEFYYDSPPPTLYSFSTRGQVLLCSSFSKTLNPGYRVGWILPGAYFEAVLKLKRMTSIATGTLAQGVIAEYMASGQYERYLRRLRPQLQQNMHKALQLIAEVFPPGTRVSQPQGGFILWVELPKNVDTRQFYPLALQQGVSFAPGILFSHSKVYRHCLRLSLNMPWSETLEQGLRDLGRLFQG